MLINRVKIYTNKEIEKKEVKNTAFNFEFIGNKHATICCFINCSSPISESKDYKTLTKVFEKLMMKIENVFVVNVKSCKSENFVHFIHEYQFKKIAIFGEDAFMSNFPISLDLFETKTYELMKIHLSKNLIELIGSKDEEMKKLCWEKLKEFYRI